MPFNVIDVMPWWAQSLALIPFLYVSAPRTWSPGELVTSGMMNTLRDLFLEIEAGTAQLDKVELVGDTSANLAAIVSDNAEAAIAYDTSMNLLVQSLDEAGFTPLSKVVQIVSATTNTPASSSSSTPADTGLTATITPKSTAHKVLVLVCQNGLFKDTSDTALTITLQRAGVDISLIEGAAAYTATTQSNHVGGSAAAYLDSPATTSATTYKTQFSSISNTATVRVQSNSARSTIVLLEVTP